MKKDRRSSSIKLNQPVRAATDDSIDQVVTLKAGNAYFWDPEWATKEFRLATKDPKSFGETLRRKLSILYEAAMSASTEPVPDTSPRIFDKQLWNHARIELLKTAIEAADLLSIFNEDDFKEIAPFEAGWPVVLAATRERTNDWARAKTKINSLHAGVNHHTRLLRYPETEVASFLDFWTWRAMPELHRRAPKIEDLKKLPQRILAALKVQFGKEWQDHHSIVVLFGKHPRWKTGDRWAKRDVVRDKAEGHAKTLQKRLKKLGRI